LREFVLFQAGFPDLQAAEEADPGDGEAVEKVAETALAVCRKKMFDYAPIDSRAIAAVAEKTARENNVNSFPSLAAALSKTKPAALERQLAPHCRFPAAPVDESGAKKWGERKKGIMEIAFARYFNALYEKALPPAPAATGEKFGKKEVRFAANAAHWTVVKKVSLENSPEEVLACLSGIHATALKKIGENTGAKQFCDVKLAGVAQSRSLPALAKALAQFSENDAVSGLEAAAAKHLTAAKEYFYSALFERFSHPPYVTAEMVGKAFPEVKIPKPRGRVAGAKKQ